MPTVPTYDNLQVAPTSQPRAEFSAPSPGAFNSIAARATAPLESASQSLQNISQLMIQQQQRRDVEKVTKAEADLVAMDTDFRRNASQRLGENAHGLTTEADKWWGETTRKMSESFENDMQRQAFDAIVQRRRTMSIDHVAGHEAQQSRVAAGQAAEASVNAHISAAAAAISSGMTPAAQETITDSRNRALKAYQAMALTNGLPAEARQAGEMQITTKMHTEVIQGLVEKDPDQAKAWFYANKKEIDGSRHAEIEKILEVGGLEAKRQQVTDDLMSRNLSYEDGLKEIQEKYSGKEEVAIKQEFKMRWGEKQEARQMAEITALAPVQTLIGDASSNGRAIGRAQRDEVLGPLRSNHPDIYYKAAKMIDQHNDEIRAEARANESHARSMAGMSPNKALNWLNLKYDMIQNPGKYKNADLRQTIFPLVQGGQLSAADAEEAIKLQSDFRKPSKQKEFTSLMTATNYLDVRLSGAVINGKKYSDMSTAERAEVKARALQTAEPLLQTYQATAGEKASDQEVKSVIDQLFVNKAYRNSFLGIEYGAKQTRTELDAEGAAPRVSSRIDARRMAEIAPATRARIVQALKKNKQPVSDAAILEYYEAGAR